MKKAKLFMMLALLVMGVSNVFAQNVTIKATNGSMIASTPTGNTDYDTFFRCGGFATWQHEQLSMVLTASDQTGKTDFGQLSNPANNLFSDGTHIQIAKGSGNYVCYLSLSLPKGYRFTGYEIKFSKPAQKKIGTDSNGDDVNVNTNTNASSFGETNSSFTFLAGYNKSVTRGGTSETISRNEGTEGSMGNVLYFKLEGGNSRAMITLESAEFFFTAEEDYTVLATPGNVQRVSAIDIPFKTSKVDYGTITKRNYNGVDRVAYSSANVKDLDANITLYEAESIKEGEDFDGSTGNVVDYKKGSISVENGYYRIGAENAAAPGETEHIYYIETPSYVLLSDRATKNPVGYRIVGAQIEYKYGETIEYGSEHNTYNTFYFSYTTTGRRPTTYYLNNTGGATTIQNQRAFWFIDEEGYIRTGVNGNTYLTNRNTVNGGTLYASTTTNKNDAVKFNITDEGYIYYTENGTNYWLNRTSSYNTNYFRFQNNTGNRATRTMSGSTTNVDIEDDILGTTTQPYTLKVYDKTGTSAEGNTVQVSSTNQSGTITLGGLNNDAIKIGVIGTGLIKGTLILQALDPYLDQMSVVCTDKQNTAIKLSQTFTASDFSVSGGEFHFYVPEDTKKVGITFEDLKSKYFDETYDGGSVPHTSRINFVKSEHYNAFGTSNNNIYTDTEEAAAGKTDVSERLKVGIVGSARFKFNNAADLTNGNGILTEYPFSIENYAAAPNNGSFGSMDFDITDGDKDATKYVFTTDETRYNIAPTTATQHRAYAYYEMHVFVHEANYHAKVEIVPVYEDGKTFYLDDNTEKTDAFYGAIVTAPYQEGGKTKQGYASYKDIYDRIGEIITAGADDATTPHTDLPESTKQILYLDLSQLAGVYHQTTTNATSTEGGDDTTETPAETNYLEQYAVNCLFFLPQGFSENRHNIAYKMESGGFRAANNIVVTDKQPFYSPYDIQVDAANYSEYKRMVTIERYGTVGKATVILPFNINVDADGLHNNKDNSGSFKLHKMQNTDAITLTNRDNLDYYAEGYFTKPELQEIQLETGKTYVAPAYKPYVVEVISGPSEEGSNQLSFIARVNGGIVYQTPDKTNYIFDGEEATSTVENVGYKFSHHGTITGRQLPNASKTTQIFYFANNLFHDSQTLYDGLALNMFPFRTYYDYQATGSHAKVSSFRVVFGENPNMGGTNGINEIQRDADLAVIPGKGVITLMAKAEKDITIHAANGQTVDKCNLKAGETRTVAVPAGVYVINGVKMVVK